jgi:hypothetical protein
MKKRTGIFLKIILGFIILILILIFTIPVIFKDKIKTRIEQVINESVNAKVNFEDYKLGFIKNFPDLTFSLYNVSVAGIDKFENDTLADLGSLNLVLYLPSLFKKTGYEIKSIIINEAAIKTLVLKDGRANWDIVADTTESAPGDESAMKILLRKIEILNSSISYIDYESDIEVYLTDVNSNMSGDLTENETNLEIMISAGELTYLMDGIKYLNKATADSKINLFARLDSMKFYLRDNYILINDLKLNFEGMVAMPEDDIEMDLTYKSEQTSLKSLLSLIPAVYMTDYSDLKTSGEFNLSGTAKGVYSDADSTMPDIALVLNVKNGLVSYPSLPEQIKNINIESDVFVDGKNMDRSIVNINAFHMELADNPFDMKFFLKTPMSDPDFSGSMKGKIDLTALSNALPLDSIDLSGLINMSVSMAGRMSMIEKEQYADFKASGNMDITKMTVAMTGYPELVINDAGFEFTPAFATLKRADLNIGGTSDFKLSGKLENYIAYVLKDEIIRGNLMLRSKTVNLSDIMSEIASDTTEIEDTTALTIIKVPENIDFNFNALIDQFVYNNIKVQNVKGKVIVKDGILSIRETGMDLLGGKILMNADYDTRDILKPLMKADMNIESLGVKDAFNTFNTIQMLAPTAKGVSGKVGVRLSYSSQLGSDFMPVISTISGGGKLQTDEVTLVESSVYKLMKESLKLSDKYTNTFKDINVSFKISNGRIFVSPFNTKVGNIRMNISGDQGIDQTINYVIKTEIPRTELGSSVNSLIDNLSVSAAALGIAFKPADIIKVNVKVTGTFLKPLVTPFFGSNPPDSLVSIKETVKETIKETVGEELEQAKEKVKSEAEIQADKLIKEAEEQGQKIRDEAAIAAEKIRKEADVQAQKLIKEAETKGALAKLGAQKAAEKANKEADKKANQLVNEADIQATKLLDEAKLKREELLNKI